MKRIDDLDLGVLINVLKNRDEVIKSIESTFFEVKDLWLFYKGNKVIPLFSLTKLMNCKKGNAPHLSTQVVETQLAQTGILCVKTLEDFKELSKGNLHHDSLPQLQKIFKRRTVEFVKLFTPASALLVLLTGSNNESIQLRRKLNVYIPTQMGHAALLGSINRALLRSNIARNSFFVGDGIELVIKDRKEKQINERLLLDKEFLAQPNVKKVVTTGENVLSILEDYLKELNHNLTISEVMMEDCKRKIEEQQSVLLKHENDYSTLLESVIAIKNAIAVINNKSNLDS